MFIIQHNFIDDVIKNTVGQIKYRESITLGEIKTDNGDGTYGVEISQCGKTYPLVPTAHYGDTFAVGEIAIITYEYGNKEMPRIWGHAKKIAQNPVNVIVDYSGSGGNPITTVTTLDAYSIADTTAYVEGRIVLSGGAGNCTRRGFKYGLTTAYGSDTHTDGDYGEGAFALQLTSLTENTTYHYQAYVLDAEGDEQVGEDKTLKTGGYSLYEYNTGTEPSSWPYIDATNKKMMQSFTAISDHNVDKISIIIGKRNVTNLGTITLGIYAVDGNGLPTGSPLTTGTVDGNTIPDWGSEIDVDFIVTQISVINTTQYAIQITCDAFAATQRLSWGLATDAYAGGKFDRYNGAAWENYNSGNSDGRFKVYGI